MKWKWTSYLRRIRYTEYIITYNLTSLLSLLELGVIIAEALFLPLDLLLLVVGGAPWLSELGLLGGEFFSWFWLMLENAPSVLWVGGGEAFIWDLLDLRLLIEILEFELWFNWLLFELHPIPPPLPRFFPRLVTVFSVLSFDWDLWTNCCSGNIHLGAAQFHIVSTIYIKTGKKFKLKVFEIFTAMFPK